LRISVVSPYSPTAIGFGGIASSTGYYLDALLHADFDVTFISSTSSLNGRTTAEEAEAQHPGLKAYFFDANISKRWGIGLGFIALIPTMLRAGLVMFHGTKSLPTLLGGLVCRLLGKPYVVVPHAGLDASRVARTRAKRPRLYAASLLPTLWALRGAKFLVLTGDLEHRTLLPEVADMPWIEVENFFDFDISAVRAGTYSRPLTYLFVGRIESDKGVIAFCEAWKAAASIESRLVIAGSGDGEYFQRFLSTVRGEHCIDYRGELPREEIAALMSSASILVLPTGMDEPISENFGNVVVEAFIAGRPAMVSKGLHWDKYAGHDALRLFEPTFEGAGDVIRAFEAIDGSTYRTMAEQAAAFAPHFHFSHSAQRLRRLVRQAVGDKTDPG
jgi:glycosyltransferase involved in cell wall biosynthesis